MPYNPYYPQSYSPYQQAMPQYQQQQNSSGLIWVQGIEAMKSYPVTPGQSVLLMDSESNCFGINRIISINLIILLLISFLHFLAVFRSFHGKSGLNTLILLIQVECLCH